MKVPKGMPIKFATGMPEHMMATAVVDFLPFDKRSAIMLDTPKYAPWGNPAINRMTSME